MRDGQRNFPQWSDQQLRIDGPSQSCKRESVPSATLHPPANAFEGDGKYVRQNRTENSYGHVCLRMTFLTLTPEAARGSIAFTVPEKCIPKQEWSMVEKGIRQWCRAQAKAIEGWAISFEVFDGSWEAGATPAFEIAAKHAVNGAAKKAVQAGLIFPG